MVSDENDEVSFGKVAAWNPQHCPKCRKPMRDPQGPCGHCGWQAMSESELVFLDTTVACPTCGEMRSTEGKACEHCGSTAILQGKSGASTYSLSSLLVSTAIVGICVALCRWLPVLGIAISSWVFFSCVRTAVLIHRRKEYGYRVDALAVRIFFAQAAAGIFLAVIAGMVIAIAVAGFVVNVPILGRNPDVRPMLVLSWAVVAGIGIALLYAHPRAKQSALIGAACLQLVAIPSFWIPESWFPLRLMVSLLFGGSVVCFALCLWRVIIDGRTSSVMGLIGGGFAGFTISGTLSFLLVPNPARVSTGLVGEFAFGMVLITVAVILTNVWSFDDAF